MEEKFLKQATRGLADALQGRAADTDYPSQHDAARPEDVQTFRASSVSTVLLSGRPVVACKLAARSPEASPGAPDGMATLKQVYATQRGVVQQGEAWGTAAKAGPLPVPLPEKPNSEGQQDATPREPVREANQAEEARVEAPGKDGADQPGPPARDEGPARFRDGGRDGAAAEEGVEPFPEGRWEYHCAVRKRWVQVDDAEDELLKRSFLKSSDAAARFGPHHVNRVPFEVDFTKMQRKNLASGTERPLRFTGQLPFSPTPLSGPTPSSRLLAGLPRGGEALGGQRGEPSLQEKRNLYRIDDKGDRVLVWLSVDGGDLLSHAKAGHIEVDIREKGLDVRVLDPRHARTLEYSWVRLRELAPQRSSWRASQDGEHLVISLGKYHRSSGCWGSLFETPGAGNQYFRHHVIHWVAPLGAMQGCWVVDADDQSTEGASSGGLRRVRVLGPVAFFTEADTSMHQHTLTADSETAVIAAHGERFRGLVSEDGTRVDWDDGEVWLRDRAADAAVLEGAARALPKGDLRARRESAAEGSQEEDAVVRITVQLWDDGRSRFGQQQQELLKMLEDSDDEDAERLDVGGAESDRDEPVVQLKPVRLTSTNALPGALLTRARICSMAAEELTPQHVPLTLSRLQQDLPLADETEVAALSALDLLLRWAYEFLTPAQRHTLAKALRKLQVLLEEVRLRQQRSAAATPGAQAARRCLPSWWASLCEPPLAKVAFGLLRQQLLRLRPRARVGTPAAGEPALPQAFTSARAAVAAQLWAAPSPVVRDRCPRAEVAWARRAARATPALLASRGDWREFGEEGGGVLVSPGSLDWTTLLLARTEAQAWLEDAVADDGAEVGSLPAECSGIDLLQTGHCHLYACAYLCQVALERVGAAATQTPSEGVTDITLAIETQLMQSSLGSGAHAFLFLATPEEPVAQWRVQFGTGSLSRDVLVSGGALLLCRRMPRLVAQLPRRAAADDPKPPWIRVSAAP
uniref:WWE domain-containing protein n=1 Tax=Alexandrium monilatum TaxID=311494 RepID=A0A6T1AQ18_9DINO